MLNVYVAYTKGGRDGGVRLGEITAIDMLSAVVSATEKWGDSVWEIRLKQNDTPMRVQ